MLNLFKDKKPWTPPTTKGMLQKQSINHKHISNIKLLYYKSLMADSIASITYSIALSAFRTTFAFLKIFFSCELFFRTSPFIFLVFSYSNQETSPSTCTMNLLFLYILEKNPSPCCIIKICNIRSKLYRTSKLIFCIHQPNETYKCMFRN